MILVMKKTIFVTHKKAKPKMHCELRNSVKHSGKDQKRLLGDISVLILTDW